MQLTPEESAWIEKREKLLKVGVALGVTLLLLLFALVFWLWVEVLQMINPWFVFECLEKERLEEGTVLMMAAMLPVAVLLMVLLLMLFILLLFQAFSNERKLIKIIQRDTALAVEGLSTSKITSGVLKM